MKDYTKINSFQRSWN